MSDVLKAILCVGGIVGIVITGVWLATFIAQVYENARNIAGMLNHLELESDGSANILIKKDKSK
ncbi:MAG: hypothetical protein KAX30_04470 [Candidatus Atribacteria bacterium]|nr:hypothetical protein [Candidatus Atribacteria bacterium]